MHTVRGLLQRMAIEVETKDCTQLSDAELAEMADICAEGPSRFEIGLLSKQAEAWVLVTLAREGAALKGFSFCTLERIGGTPCVLIGLRVGEAHLQARHGAAGAHDRPVPPGRAGLPRRGRAGRQPLRQRRRLRGVQDPRRHRPPPRPQGHRRGAGLGSAPGQALRRRERRLRRPDLHRHGRRHASRWRSTTSRSSPRSSTPAVVAFFDDVDPARGDSLIAFGWAMAEDLAKLR